MKNTTERIQNTNKLCSTAIGEEIGWVTMGEGVTCVCSTCDRNVFRNQRKKQFPFETLIHCMV